jgi:hypothetical protein
VRAESKSDGVVHLLRREAEELGAGESLADEDVVDVVPSVGTQGRCLREAALDVVSDDDGGDQVPA